MAVSHHEIKEQIRELIYNTCIHLDDYEWQKWHNNCADNFNYAIRAFSPEVQTDIKYHGGDKEYMESITNMLNKHNSDQSPLRRHCTVYRVDVAEDGKSATAISSLTVHQTQLDGVNSHVDAGTTSVFLVGRYNDTFVIDGKSIKFEDREVRLDTRRLDKGTHWPI
ncbi:nuclear transport factor 2 family protein [Oceanospirillaceae bacterium]|jgi:methanesulfonate monooxygenase small subunit|nr:SnoaL-like domain-containing protein [Oceanospirillaceae bacterium]MDA9279633.1 nuclear transport factor 2 family protein [bacterium]MBT5629903.1 SnoaL-like domain-containing protein [Oceanospirillaceae bacterium]MBT6101581.1 SnoaL-like domain-containing protein [Oceanospirillaceae bacterium]MBT7672904.1 SnoaL-like domain-containing protein [Oceanospirillaceae bacterium]|tara:strand:- start:891 stop:1388 length:498 start_codon:yes stop_codon:yes gene_type:complete